jgi:nucleoside-diphosphate-sugar epimerase
MRVLIIGGTGLISSTTTQVLTARGDAVVLFNRGKSTVPPAPGAKCVSGDRTDYPAFARQVSALGRFDAVIDMVGYQPADGDSVIQVFAGQTGQFIFCSTVDVYQKPASHYPVRETEPYGGLNDYSRNKVIIEQKLRAAAEQGAFPLTIIRPAYTYGEGRGPIHPISWGKYIHRLRSGLPIVVQGDGQSLWTCAHQGDVGRCFAAAAGRPAAFGQCYHVAGEEWLTWNQYHLQAAAALGAPSPDLAHIPSDFLARVGVTICAENFQFSNIFDNSAARRDLDYQYTVPWKEGVQRMARWLDEHDSLEHSGPNEFEDRLVSAWRKACTQLVGELQA